MEERQSPEAEAAGDAGAVEPTASDSVEERETSSEANETADAELEAELLGLDEESEEEEPLEEDEEPPVDARAILEQARAQAASSVAAEETPDLSETPDERAWFVIHCYSGYEKKVQHNLMQRIETMGMANQIFQVVVPTEEEIEVKEGKRRTVERRVFPGYILVQMMMNDDSWYVVRNTPGVTGFVGMGNKPTALRSEEVTGILKRMEAEAPKVKVTFKPGQKVRIVDGPFNDFMGVVDDIDMDKAKARVMVSFFGRDTPVELDFLQVEKV
jgi:transcriptional antiterminator NusG